MAITKRMRISFDIKTVIPTEGVANATEALVGLAKAYAEGEKLDGLQLALLKVALEGGVDEALTFALKKTLKEELVIAINDSDITGSNFRFEVKR